MRLGVSGGRIHLVQPPDNTPSPCFHDSAVELAVRQVLEKEKIHVHHNCLLAQINDGQHPDPITCVSFTTDGPPLRLECAVSEKKTPQIIEQTKQGFLS